MSRAHRAGGVPKMLSISRWFGMNLLHSWFSLRLRIETDSSEPVLRNASILIVERFDDSHSHCTGTRSDLSTRRIRLR
eukprot:scaffold2363_cov159-Amphora_coffeaeformis.AAC.46